MSDKIGIRRSQLIMPFGVGAVLDVGNESFVAADISEWRHTDRMRQIRLDRLSRFLGRRLLEPPVPLHAYQNNPPTVPFLRFPTWFFCARCRRMYRWWPSNTRERGTPHCARCNRRRLVPMRFVTACKNGHLDEVPWHFWAHSQRAVATHGRCETRNQLEFRALGGSGGSLASLIVKCTACDAQRSLEGIADAEILQRYNIPCRGRHPWERNEIERDCNEPPRVLQRGAGNLYYPSTVSALDIPEPDGDINTQITDAVRNHAHYNTLIGHMNDTAGDVESPLQIFLADQIAVAVNCEPAQVLAVATADTAGDATDPCDGGEQREVDMMRAEWLSLCSPPPPEVAANAYFQAERRAVEHAGDSAGLDSLLQDLIIVRKLREVRALRGFHRIMPGDPERMMPVDLDKGENWVPAVEVFGEGIFLRFAEPALSSWEQLNSGNFSRQRTRLQERIEQNRLSFLPEPSPRFIMLHTIAHLLIRQLAFECGYSASALRERIYSASSPDREHNMAGILIYTADSDSEGSLGGLVRQGEPERFGPMLIEALRKSIWCSSDPICRELDAQGLGGLNTAACHACCLVSETSCVHSNSLLDRTLVTGNGADGRAKGFFYDFVARHLGIGV